jgi:hypothetical protein
VSDISLDSDSVKAQPKNGRDASTSVRAFNREDRYVEGSKRLRNRRQTKIDLENVSTYKAAPGRAGQQRVRKKDLTRGGLGDRELRGNMMDRYLCFEVNKLLSVSTPARNDVNSIGSDEMKPATGEEDRPTEDDIARKNLGPRGIPGAPDTAKMTRQEEKNIPKSGKFDGHTA